MALDESSILIGIMVGLLAGVFIGIVVGERLNNPVAAAPARETISYAQVRLVEKGIPRD